MLQAAERNPKDVTLWMPLIDFAEDEGDLKQAIVYARNGRFLYTLSTCMHKSMVGLGSRNRSALHCLNSKV